MIAILAVMFSITFGMIVVALILCLSHAIQFICAFTTNTKMSDNNFVVSLVMKWLGYEPPSGIREYYNASIDKERDGTIVADMGCFLFALIPWAMRSYILWPVGTNIVIGTFVSITVGVFILKHWNKKMKKLSNVFDVDPN